MVMPTMPRSVKSPIASNKPVYLTTKRPEIGISANYPATNSCPGEPAPQRELGLERDTQCTLSPRQTLCGILTLEDPVARRFGCSFMFLCFDGNTHRLRCLAIG